MGLEYKYLTENQKIPSLGLGTWGMGGWMRPDRSQDAKYIRAIEYALEKGITHIDTAEFYGAGHAEELIGEVIKSVDRKRLFITSKVLPIHLSYESILKAAEKSTKRLDTDYLDLYLIHWPNPLASTKNAMAGFDKLVDQGLVKFIGVSNFSVSQFQNAQKYASHKLVCNQVRYNLLDRRVEDELLKFCQEERVILTAYSPLAEGELTRQKFEQLEEVAKKYGKTPVQVALRWLLEKPQVITIPKASSPDHIDEILGTLGWKLEKEDRDYLDGEFA